MEPEYLRRGEFDDAEINALHAGSCERSTSTRAFSRRRMPA